MTYRSNKENGLKSGKPPRLPAKHSTTALSTVTNTYRSSSVSSTYDPEEVERHRTMTLQKLVASQASSYGIK
jgi:hypothetical protein